MLDEGVSASMGMWDRNPEVGLRCARKSIIGCKDHLYNVLFHF